MPSGAQAAGAQLCAMLKMTAVTEMSSQPFLDVIELPATEFYTTSRLVPASLQAACFGEPDPS